MANLSHISCRQLHCPSSSSRNTNDSSKLKQKFPDKLWSVVCDENEDSCVWNSTGDSLLINKGKFSQRFLSNTSGLFRTSKFKSFVRQLNLYGFRKVNKMRRRDYEIWWEYQNENFIRDRPDLLKQIKRKATIDDFYDCGNCSKSRINKRRREGGDRPLNSALDLRLASFDDSNECQENHNEGMDIASSQREKKVSLGEIDLGFSEEESRPAINEEPFVINIPLSQKQIWDNDSYITFSLFPDLPSSQEANPLIGITNSDTNELPNTSKAQFSFNSIFP